MEDFPYDEYYSGFGSYEFNPGDEIDYLQGYCKEYPYFNDWVLEWYRVRQTYDMLNLKTNTVKHTLDVVDKYKKTHDFDNCAFILLNAKVMSNIYEARNSMKSDERAVWAMYMGILSIIGDKDFAQTTSDMIKCRMFGASNRKELDLLLKDKALKKVHDKYTSKYKYNKLLNIIQDRNMITEIGLKRRTYVSHKIKSVDGLVVAISAKEIESERRKQRNDEKTKARAKYYSLLQPKDESINIKAE